MRALVLKESFEKKKKIPCRQFVPFFVVYFAN